MNYWKTHFNGNTYRLTEHGRLEKEEHVSTAHLEQMRENRHRDVARAVHAELLQLAIRRAEQHAKEQPR